VGGGNEKIGWFVHNSLEVNEYLVKDKIRGGGRKGGRGYFQCGGGGRKRGHLYIYIAGMENGSLKRYLPYLSTGVCSITPDM